MKTDSEKQFQLPIYYNTQKKQVNETILNDLELNETVDVSNNPIYAHVFDFKTSGRMEDNNPSFAINVMKQSTKYYTTDIFFLKENQTLIQRYEYRDFFTNETEPGRKKDKYIKINELWNEIKEDTGFKEKYYYIDWPMWEFLNKSETFLQCMSIYNMTSPVISLLLPIIILIIPFFIIQLKGLHLTIQEYIEVLKLIVSQHALGKLFNEFNDVSLNQKFYLLVSAAFYLFSIYQNVLLCLRFHQNMSKIHDYFKEIKIYLDETIQRMNYYLSFSNDLKTHNEFNVILIENIKTLTDLREKINFITDYKLSVKKIFEVGAILKHFYEIYDNFDYENAFLYSFGFHGYLDCLDGIKNNINAGKMNYTKFIDKNSKKEKSILKGNYYAVLKDKKPVKNTVKLNKNMIITGPNASGKTTILKATLINILLSQQFGCGFYNKGTILEPFDYIHCYLNIPDTSGRDSLFQAEARRCKEIIDFIQEKEKKERHFCVFDELYSGTNPEESVVSAISFMEYLVKNKNVFTMLTTHYTEVCESLENSTTKIVNYHMKIHETNENNEKDFQYTYILINGISKAKGGIKVLKDLNYPKEILENLIRS